MTNRWWYPVVWQKNELLEYDLQNMNHIHSHSAPNCTPEVQHRVISIKTGQAAKICEKGKDPIVGMIKKEL